ncbi:MAG: LSU ribosomal protein L30p (L7e), partial [uncultured Acidimicrobiales bacterium]
GSAQGPAEQVHDRLQGQPARDPAHARSQADRRRGRQGGPPGDPRHGPHRPSPGDGRGSEL